MINNFLESNFGKVVEDFENLNPKDRTKLYCELLQYGLPKLQSVEMESQLERLPDDQIDEIIKRITFGAEA
jgi:hypothetical protein